MVTMQIRCQNIGVYSMQITAEYIHKHNSKSNTSASNCLSCSVMVVFFLHHSYLDIIFISGHVFIIIQNDMYYGLVCLGLITYSLINNQLCFSVLSAIICDLTFSTVLSNYMIIYASIMIYT